MNSAMGFTKAMSGSWRSSYLAAPIEDPVPGMTWPARTMALGLSISKAASSALPAATRRSFAERASRG